jgi:hypothetical protein
MRFIWWYLSIPNNKENKASCSSVLLFTVLPSHQSAYYSMLPSYRFDWCFLFPHPSPVELPSHVRRRWGTHRQTPPLNQATRHPRLNPLPHRCRGQNSNFANSMRSPSLSVLCFLPSSGGARANSYRTRCISNRIGISCPPSVKKHPYICPLLSNLSAIDSYRTLKNSDHLARLAAATSGAWRGQVREHGRNWSTSYFLPWIASSQTLQSPVNFPRFPWPACTITEAPVDLCIWTLDGEPVFGSRSG